jgi:hypothetical protein
MNLSEITTLVTDWALRPNCLSDIYLTQDQQNEVFEWLLNNRKSERNNILNAIREKFSDDSPTPFGY